MNCTVRWSVNLGVREKLPWMKALLSWTIFLNLRDFDKRRKPHRDLPLSLRLLIMHDLTTISPSSCIIHCNGSDYLKTDHLNIALYNNKAHWKSTLLLLSEPQEEIDMNSLFSQTKKIKHKEVLQLPQSVLMEKLGPHLVSWNFHHGWSSYGFWNVSDVSDLWFTWLWSAGWLHCLWAHTVRPEDHCDAYSVPYCRLWSAHSLCWKLPWRAVVSYVPEANHSYRT